MIAIDLSQALDMDKLTVSGIIKRLEEKQINERKANVSDKRSFGLYISEKGMNFLKSYQLVKKF